MQYFPWQFFYINDKSILTEIVQTPIEHFVAAYWQSTYRTGHASKNLKPDINQTVTQ
jgi:hypothetical protein